MASGCLARIVFSDVKHNFILHYAAALLVLLVSPAVFSFSELDSRLAAQPLEAYVPLIGIILMTPIFMPEQNTAIRDVVMARKTDHELVCFLRLMCSIITAAVMTGAVVLYMKHCNSDVNIKSYIGSLISVITLGAAGFAVAGISGNVIAGYMTSVIYFVLNLSLGNKLGKLYLFSMMNGDLAPKKYLLALSFILIAIVFVYRKLLGRR